MSCIGFPLQAGNKKTKPNTNGWSKKPHEAYTAPNASQAKTDAKTWGEGGGGMAAGYQSYVDAFLKQCSNKIHFLLINEVLFYTSVKFLCYSARTFVLTWNRPTTL